MSRFFVISANGTSDLDDRSVYITDKNRRKSIKFTSAMMNVEDPNNDGNVTSESDVSTNEVIVKRDNPLSSIYVADDKTQMVQTVKSNDGSVYTRYTLNAKNEGYSGTPVGEDNVCDYISKHCNEEIRQSNPQMYEGNYEVQYALYGKNYVTNVTASAESVEGEDHYLLAFDCYEDEYEEGE